MPSIYLTLYLTDSGRVHPSPYRNLSFTGFHTGGPRVGQMSYYVDHPKAIVG